MGPRIEPGSLHGEASDWSTSLQFLIGPHPAGLWLVHFPVGLIGLLACRL